MKRVVTKPEEEG